MMESTQEKAFSPLKVFLLLSDLKEAKKIAKVFREIGVLPSVFENLEDFWNITLTEVPALALVDGECLEDGSYNLARHPMVRKEQLPLAIYHADGLPSEDHLSTRIFHLGDLFRHGDYHSSLRSLLKRVNRFRQLDKQVEELSGRTTKRDFQMTKILQTSENIKEREHYHILLKNICNRFDLHQEMDDFYQVMTEVFDSMEEVTDFSVLELSFNGQKLVSPKMISAKFREIPSLWLGQTCQNGIEFFAQNMASQVALDMFGGNQMTLFIRGRFDGPEKMIFLKLNDQELLGHLDWEFFEKYLSGVYTQMSWRGNRIGEITGQVLNSWDLFSLMDQVAMDRFHLDPEKPHRNLSLINVDFSPLMELIKETGCRFYWKSFYHDFVTRFQRTKEENISTCAYTPEHLGFIVDEENEDHVFYALKTFSHRFPFWRYFDDADLVLTRNIRPEIEVIPFSIDSIWRHLSGELRQFRVGKRSIGKLNPSVPTV